MAEEIVDIVNENDEVIGKTSKNEAHEKPLYHRIVGVWFYNSKGQVFLQKRSFQKKDLPGYLEWTVSGHVASGETYEEALVRETQEETGVSAKVDNFVFLGQFIPNLHRDGRPVTHLRKIYALKFDGNKEDLRFDPAEVDSFEVWTINELVAAMEKKDGRFFEFFWLPFSYQTIKQLQKLVG